MKCDYYIKLIHLNRPGELKESEQKKLKNHLRICPDCRKVKQELEKMSAAVIAVKENEPVISDPKKLTANIIQEIKQLEKKKIKKHNPILYNILDIFSRERFRYSLAAVVSGILLIFLIQQIYIINKISGLEQKVSTVSSRETGDDSIIISSESIRKIFDVSKFPQLENTDLYRQLINNETITIDRRFLESLMEKYKTLESENLILKLIIRDRFPDFDESALQKELDRIKKRKTDIFKLFFRKL